MAMVIEQCQVVPPPGELTLPLTFFDIVWLNFHRIRRILFYKLSVTKLDFVKTIIPTLKHSLSLALQHYMILAGNVVYPLNSNNLPELRYVTGDSVSVTFSESDMDFNFLIGDYPKNAKDFYHFVPKLAEPCKRATGDVQLAPLLAIQVTLFPNHGISIGFTNHHVVGDGASIVGFIKAWAMLNKFDENEPILGENFRPFYDRLVIKDPYGSATLQWDITKKYKAEMRDIFSIPSNDKVRGTFILGHDDIIKLKSLILSRRPGLTHDVTSFTVTCAYVWTCLIKSEIATTKEEIEDEYGLEYFLCAADCRAQLNPSLPPNYFGNCIVGYIASTRHVDLAGKEGFTIGAEVIGEVIRKRREDEKWILNGHWAKEVSAIDKNRKFSVAGSPKHDFYAVDFSWGRTEKFVSVSIDSDTGIAMSLSKSRNSDENLEVGLCLSKNRMNAFAAIFNHGLSIL